MAEKTRYSDEELKEFKELILDKLEKAKEDYDLLKSSITQEDGNDTQDTSPTFKVLEEGASVLSKEESGKLAQRQLKFIQPKIKRTPPRGTIMAKIFVPEMT